MGPTTKVSTQVLHSTFEALGCTDVATLINSGNVVFTAQVLVITAPELTRIANEMPFEGDESKLVALL